MKEMLTGLMVFLSYSSLQADIFKIMTDEQYDEFKRMRVYAGNAHDLRDGFLHMAKQSQVKRVIEKYYPQRPVYIVSFSENIFGKNLKYEAASNGDLYPHIYDQDLQWNDVNYVFVLTH